MAPKESPIVSHPRPPRRHKVIPRKVHSIYRSRGQLPPLIRWMICWGSWVFLPTFVLFMISAFVMGWRKSYLLLVGGADPSTARTPFLPWALSFTGWVIAPTAIAAVVGYAVFARVGGYRTRPVSDVQKQLQDRAAEARRKYGRN